MARVGCSPEHPKYVAGCAGCATIGRREKELAKRRKATGRGRTYLPIGDVRPHTLALRQLGWKVLDIARAALVSSTTIDEVCRENPRNANIDADNAKRILAIELRPFDPKPKTGEVNAVGTARRIQALAALGHSMSRQAKQANLSHHQVMMIARGEIQFVKQETAAAVAALYDAWSTKPGEYSSGGSSWTIRRDAEAKGWHDPLAWHKIDDPACQPEVYDDETPRGADDVDWVNIRHALAGASHWVDLTHAERVIVVTELVRRLPDPGVAEILGVPGTTVCKFRERNGIPGATDAVLDRWQEELKQLRRYAAPPGEVRRRYDLHEAAA